MVLQDVCYDHRDPELGRQGLIWSEAVNVQNGVLLGALLAVIVYAVRDGFLFWLLIRWTLGRAGGTGVPLPGPWVSGPGTLPGPTPQPTSPPAPRFTGITATSFGGAGDANASAYGGMVDPNKPGVALPFRFSGTRPTVRVFYGEKSVDCPIVDVGPWNINDPYWQTGTRPQAESGEDTTGRTTNLAGIDLTPAAWIALGVPNPNSVKTKVNWDFVNVLDAPATGTASQVPATPVSSPVGGQGDPPWIIKGRQFDGLVWHQGQPMPPAAVTWIDNIATTFPEMAPYCKVLKELGAKGWWAWCGFFVQSMLAYSNIRGPMSAAGLKGETTVEDWAYAASWKDWGTKVWAPEDGDISNANPQPGDVLVWSFGHVSFYDHPEPTTNTFASLGGDQGTPLRVCIEDIAMSSCIAIRRPPT